MHHSRAITRKSASNLALAFILLPRHKREAMAALYAFCREVDDAADDESVPVDQRRSRLAQWRTDILRACQDGQPEFMVNRELQPVIRACSLPFELFDELIKGCEMDLDQKRYQTFEELELYCHRVASVVGLLSIEVFGYKNEATRKYAIHLGKALQLTNILRDVKTDARRGRIYLPLQELEAFGVTEADVLGLKYSGRFRALAASVAARARCFYALARSTLPPQDRRSMAAAELMGSVYWKLLLRMEQRDFRVLDGQPIRLSRPYKLMLILDAWLRLAAGGSQSGYGEAGEAGSGQFSHGDTEK
ncbi:MAG: presqualene diphosphate synthase HpnD [Verrucomicrobia bacterium]|nr:presqualene diphosphate synthase HpnD [Verrucomicrobiota bacterium]